MKQRLIVLTSIFITVVVLVIIGAVSTSVMAQKNANQSSAATDVVKTYQDREAQYNQLLQEANQRLEKANADLVTMQNQVNQIETQVQGQPAASGNAAGSNVAGGIVAVNTANGAALPATAVTAKQAADIAQKVADGLLPPVKTPELVSFKGTTAYEVSFAKGAIYVDASNGQVLYNGTVPQVIDGTAAAKIAADFMKDTDVLQVDKVSLSKVPLWRVIFHSGNMVYIQLDGQILYVNMKDTTVTLQTGGGGGGGNGGGSTTPPSGGGHHEDDHGDSGHGDD